ncbi:MAG TPA: polysaccharide deacetylase family protein [Polyangiaceae bacterium]|jgi:peptidoglycan/xylan/chitin deacetylase (PgdA/CDA1 family)|nr:polysaccharide deacetylase family protein [Polyangiaceae bacterium]
MPPARLALYAATVGVMATAAYSVVRRPPPVGWALLLLLGYAGLLAAGVLRLRLRVFLDATVRGPRGARGVALTFEGGPDARWTPRVLEVLAQHGAKATFFVVGRRAEANPEVLRAIAEAGHAVGLQSYATGACLVARGDGRVRVDLEQGVAALESILGRRAVLFRPPLGRSSPAIARAAEALGLEVVGWSVDAGDGAAHAKPRDVALRVRRHLRDRAIVRLHDGAPAHAASGDREPAGVRALTAIVKAMEADRLPGVSLSTWLESTGPA